MPLVRLASLASPGGVTTQWVGVLRTPTHRVGVATVHLSYTIYPNSLVRLASLASTGEVATQWVGGASHPQPTVSVTTQYAIHKL
jgi:hypothetical protein